MTQPNPQANRTDLHHCHLENGVCIYCKLPQLPLQANKTLREILDEFLVWHWQQFSTGKYKKLGHVPESQAVQEKAEAAIHQLLEEARLDEADKALFLISAYEKDAAILWQKKRIATLQANLASKGKGAE